MNYIEYGFYIIILILVFLLVYIPKRNQQKQLEKMQSNLKVGDMVITYSGLSGEIESIEEEKIIIKSNPDKIRLTVEKWAIADKSEQN